MANHYVRTGSLGTASGTSWSNARGFSDITSWWPSVAPGDSVLFRSGDDFYVTGHGNSPSFRIEGSGTATAPIKVRGATNDGDPAPWYVRGDRMAEWDSAKRTTEQGKGLWDIDGDYIVIRGLVGTRMSWVFRIVGGNHTGLDFRNNHFTQITRMIETKTGTDAGALRYSWIRNNTGVGFSKQFLKIQDGSAYVYIQDNVMDSQFQDGDNFCGGVAIDGDAHHVYVDRCRMMNIRDTLNSYQNGDGVSAESSNAYVYVRNCYISNVTDGGVDSKATNTFVENTKIVQAKRSFRSWSPSYTVRNCLSVEPRIIGGTGGPVHFWHSDAAGPMKVYDTQVQSLIEKTTICDAAEGHIELLGRTRIFRRPDANLESNEGGDAAVFGPKVKDVLVDPIGEYSTITVGASTHADNGDGTIDTITLTKPTGVVAGNILFMTVFALASGNVNTPTGFTKIDDTYASAGGGDNKLYTFYRVADGTEPSSWTVTHQFTDKKMSGGVVVLSGVDTSSPVANAAEATTTVSSTSHTSVGYLATTSKALVFYTYGFRANVTFSADAATTEVYEQLGANGVSHALASEQWTGGITTTPARTGTPSSTCVGVQQTVAFRPAPA